MGCEKYAEYFDSLEEVFKASSEDLKNKEIPAHPRKYIKMIIE